MSSASSRGGSENPIAPTSLAVDADRAPRLARGRGPRRGSRARAGTSRCRPRPDDGRPSLRCRVPAARRSQSGTRAGACASGPRARARARTGERELVERRGEAKNPGRVESPVGGDVLDPRRSQRDRAGLVEDDRPRLAQPLDHAGALDDDPGPCGTRDAGEQRDRRREDQRARRGDDEDRKRADRVAGSRPRGARHGQRQRQEERGIAVGHPHERRALGLGLPDETDKRRICALRSRPGRAESKRRSADSSAPHGLSGVAEDRQRLAGQRRLVEHRFVALDHSVDRQHLARPDEHEVADADVLDWNLHDLVAADQVGGARRARDEPRQLASRPRSGSLLERVPAREHERDHGTGEVLAQREARRPSRRARSRPRRGRGGEAFARPTTKAGRGAARRPAPRRRPPPCRDRRGEAPRRWRSTRS